MVLLPFWNNFRLSCNHSKRFHTYGNIWVKWQYFTILNHIFIKKLLLFIPFINLSLESVVKRNIILSVFLVLVPYNRIIDWSHLIIFMSQLQITKFPRFILLIEPLMQLRWIILFILTNLSKCSPMILDRSTKWQHLLFNFSFDLIATSFHTFFLKTCLHLT